MRPIIGITQCLDDRGRWRAGRRYVYADLAYTRAVEDAGGTPVHLPIQRDVKTLVDAVDALIVPGGDDFLPHPPIPPYPAHVRFEPAPAAQIAFDQSVLASALEAGLPVLGICYGMQLLALHHGGTLHYDLPSDLPNAEPHQLPEPAGRHALGTEPGTRLRSILGEPALPVNSLHHQAVCEPGAGMRVSARSPDGVVEAIESTGDRFELGVQWHPEKLTGEPRLALFEALIAQAGAAR